MIEFPVHTPDTAPEGSGEQLEQVNKGFGFIPNLFGVLAEAPAALEAYSTLGSIFDKTSFTPAERQVVLLSVSAENGCGYCMAAHTVVAGMQKVPQDAVNAIRNGEQIPDEKLEALRRFTTAVVRSRAELDDSEIGAFVAAGYSRPQILEVMVGVAMKTLSNYVNHVADTPVDDNFASATWEGKTATASR